MVSFSPLLVIRRTVFGLAAGALLIMSACTGGSHHYPAPVVQTFMDACGLSGASAAYCSCALAEIEKEFDLEEFTKFGLRIWNTGQIPEEFAGIISECLTSGGTDAPPGPTNVSELQAAPQVRHAALYADPASFEGKVVSMIGRVRSPEAGLNTGYFGYPVKARLDVLDYSYEYFESACSGGCPGEEDLQWDRRVVEILFAWPATDLPEPGEDVIVWGRVLGRAGGTFDILIDAEMLCMQSAQRLGDGSKLSTRCWSPENPAGELPPA